MQVFGKLAQKTLSYDPGISRFKKQRYLPDSWDMYLWCGRAVYHRLQSWF